LHFDTTQWVVAVIGAFAVGLSKTGIGGLGVLAVALFAYAMPGHARGSVGLLLPILICADIIAITMYRRHAVWTHLVRVSPWSIVGVLIGWRAVKHIDDVLVGHLIGAILLTLVIVHYVRAKTRKAEADDVAAPGRPTWRQILPVACIGIMAGFTTMVANAAGPIMIIYLLAARLPKMEFIGTAAWYFFCINVFKVPFSLDAAMMTTASLQTDLILAPVAIAGAFAGRVIIRHINQALFENLALGLTLVAGLRMLDVWSLVVHAR
jgi:uncharacterized membrane protein YfcA